MSIRRVRLAFEDHYTQVRNEWVRDTRLTRKARGLLVELMSHRVGWDITIDSLIEGGPEGRDAIRTAVAELERFGYLARARERNEDGTLAGIDYEIRDPWADEPTSDNPTLGNPPPKKNISQEEHLQEQEQAVENPLGARAFNAIWEMWPKKTGEFDARREWNALPLSMRKAAAQRLPVHANAFRQHTPPQFIPRLSEMIGKRRWDEPLAQPRDAGTRKPEVDSLRGVIKPPPGKRFTGRYDEVSGAPIWEDIP